MSVRSWMRSIMAQIGPEHLELFALEFGKIAEYELFTLYHLQILTNQHQTWSKCMLSLDIHTLIFSDKSGTMDLIFDNGLHSTLFTL